MILYCDLVKNCIYNEHGKCDAGKVEIVNGQCETFVKKESEVEEEGKPLKETEKESEVVMYISSPNILTQESIDFWEKEYGIELRCDICNVRLQPGDQKDHLWPYLSDYNRCRKCLEKEVKKC